MRTTSHGPHVITIRINADQSGAVPMSLTPTRNNLPGGATSYVHVVGSINKVRVLGAAGKLAITTVIRQCRYRHLNRRIQCQGEGGDRGQSGWPHPLTPSSSPKAEQRLSLEPFPRSSKEDSRLLCHICY